MLQEERRAKILEIIAAQEIETQEELCRALNAADYSVTQATVSRDIKSLRLLKVSGEKKKYRYACPKESGAEILPGKFRNLFKESVVSVRCACNLVVIKTLSGNASNAGLVLDELNFDEVVGTVAGDDTLFAACTDENSAQAIREKLNGMLK